MEEKKRILIVEDERAIVEILKFNLMREGYDTLEALDGELGLELARTKDPDLILLDVMLPKMNGFEICQNLRECLLPSKSRCSRCFPQPKITERTANL